MPSKNDAEVLLHGERVGFLEFDKGGSRFTYVDSPAEAEHRVLGQIFEDDPSVVRGAKVGLPEWFANLLPEGALKRHVIRDLGGGNIGDYTLLLRLGRHLPGAVTVHAGIEPDDDASFDPALPIADEPLRHSLAGVQLKFSVSSDKFTTPVSGGGGWWIAKLPDQSAPNLPTNEYITLHWLAEAGFPVPRTALVPASSIAGIPSGLVGPAEEVFLTERFDRSPEGRVHVEDFAQVANVPPMFKYSESGATYESLGSVVHALTGEPGYHDYLRRLVAMLVVGNTDAHLKNWGLLYADGRTPSLSPVYDFHSLTVYSQYHLAPLALSVNGERVPSRISLDDLRRLAESAGVGAQWTEDVVSETVHSLRAAWSGELRTEAESRFPALAEHYSQRLDSLPICLVA